MEEGLRVIGAGFGRTGTTSLKAALEQLGFSKCYHMDEVFTNNGHVETWLEVGDGSTADWGRIYSGYRAALDWPSCNYWRQLRRAYPDAVVLLSERDPDAWYKSIVGTIYPASVKVRDSKLEALAVAGKMTFAQIWDSVFEGRIEDKDFAIEKFLAHNLSVRNEVPADQLIVHKPGDGWAPLCEKLGVTEPVEPFPHLNTTQWFLENREV